MGRILSAAPSRGYRSYPNKCWLLRRADAIVTVTTTKTIIREHETYQKGWLYFVANDPRVPADVRKEMSRWGLPKDEFKDNGGWPHQIYVREARRMVGPYVITQADCEHRKVADDSVGMGAYNMDSHNCQRVVQDGVVRNEGDVQVSPSGPALVTMVTTAGAARRAGGPWPGSRRSPSSNSGGGRSGW